MDGNKKIVPSSDILTIVMVGITLPKCLDAWVNQLIKRKCKSTMYGRILKFYIDPITG